MLIELTRDVCRQALRMAGKGHNPTNGDKNHHNRWIMYKTTYAQCHDNDAVVAVEVKLNNNWGRLAELEHRFKSIFDIVPLQISVNHQYLPAPLLSLSFSLLSMASTFLVCMGVCYWQRKWDVAGCLAGDNLVNGFPALECSLSIQAGL